MVLKVGNLVGQGVVKTISIETRLSVSLSLLASDIPGFKGPWTLVPRLWAMGSGSEGGEASDFWEARLCEVGEGLVAQRQSLGALGTPQKCGQKLNLCGFGEKSTSNS